MINFIDLKERFEYVSPLDITEPKTIFVLRNLTSSAKAKGLLQFSENMQVESMFTTLKEAIVEIRSGENIVKDVSIDVLNSIPIDVLMGLYNLVISKNILTDTDKKN